MEDEKCTRLVTKTITVAKLSELEERKGVLIECNEHSVALYKYNGCVFALENRCSHAGGPLCDGDIEDMVFETGKWKDQKRTVIMCPWHRLRFDAVTGEGQYDGSSVKPYPTKIDGDEVKMEFSIKEEVEF